VVRGEMPGASLHGVAEALAGAAGTAALPQALRARRLRPLAAEERVARRAALALWSLTQPIAELRELRVTRRAGSNVVWADAVLRVPGDDSRPVIVGAASVGWAMEGDHLAAWLGTPLDDLAELLLVAADQPEETPGVLWRFDGPGLDEPGDPLGQALVELFVDLKRGDCSKPSPSARCATGSPATPTRRPDGAIVPAVRPARHHGVGSPPSYRSGS
jgi:hypothetical protein